MGKLVKNKGNEKIKPIEERAECALWFAKSFGLTHSWLNFKDFKSYETYSLEYQAKTTSRAEETAGSGPEELSESQASQIEQMDGARMSRTTNFVILLFCLLQNEENAMS